MTPRKLASSLKTTAFCTTAFIALSATGAWAQVSEPGAPDQTAPEVAGTAEGAASVDEVVITGSRVIRNGFTAPTPVTVITADQLQQTGPNSLSDAVNQLPQFKNSFVPASTGPLGSAGGGGSFVNLRGLSARRTLVLLDSKRVVQSQVSSVVAGATDLNMLPQSLVQRVDVVTGGASAAYGADALAGVVNFVLDKKFTGLKGEIRGGMAEAGDNQSYAFSIAGGRSFMGGRGHFIASYEYARSLGMKDWTDRSWARDSIAVINTTTAAPQTSTSSPTRILAPNVRPSNMTSGGLITAGPAALVGQYFSGPGTVSAFPFGTQRTATTMSGGGVDPDYGRYFNAIPPQNRHNAFGRIQYEVAPDWTVYAEGMFGYNAASFRGILSSPATNAGSFTIFADNPYLSPQVRAAMAGGPSTALFNPATGQFNGPATNTIQVGRLNTDWGFHREYSMFSLARGVLGVDGRMNAFGRDWNVTAYYTHGESVHKTRSSGNAYLPRLYEAVDAVASPGGAGLPAAGTAICRSTLTSPSNGCVPLNVLGAGTATQAALDYIRGGAGPNGSPTLRQVLKQDVVDFAVNGDLFDLPAGPVSVGAGFTYRKESAVGRGDPISEQALPAIAGAPSFRPGVTPALTLNGFPTGLRGALGGWESTNQSSFRGSYDVKEVFGEVLIPLLKDHSFARSFDLNGAIRYADYSTSGGVLNWKVGLTYRPFDDLRIRTTRSRDVRAANLSDLYAGNTQSNPAVLDLFRNNENNPNALTIGRGNTALDPEKGDTFTLGAVYQPSWLTGFSMSVDYYNIVVTDPINAPGGNNIVSQCFQGNSFFCSLIVRDPSAPLVNGVGPITTVFNSPINAGSQKTSGVDIESSYRVPLSRFWEDRNDTLTIRVLANYLGKLQSQAPFATSITRQEGVVGTAIPAGAGGGPKWAGSLGLNYENGPVTLFWQTRYIGSGRNQTTVDEQGNPLARNLLINPNPTGNGLVPNKVKAVFYSDLTLNYKFGMGGETRPFEAFLTVNNVFDKDPPNLGTFFFYGVLPTNYQSYDIVGRRYTAGLRFRF